MPAQAGKDLLLKIDMNGTGSFQTVAGLRATRVTLNAESVDVTTLDSPGGWRELLAGAGLRSASVTGSGVFKDETTDARVRTLFFAGQHPACQIVIPGFGTLQGPFQIGSIDYAGTHDGEATFELSLASAGQVSFAAMGA
jgi:TP901-1 family phage major tail protein